MRNIGCKLTGAAALVGAIATLVAAMGGFNKSAAPPSTTGTASIADGCTAPYVWRLAVPSDHVCVSETSRKRTEQENQQADRRRQANGGNFGADTCQTGYVWREAFEGDTVCVPPERRSEIKQENALGAERIKR